MIDVLASLEESRTGLSIPGYGGNRDLCLMCSVKDSNAVSLQLNYDDPWNTE